MEIIDYWDSISEYELDDSWQKHQAPEYAEYRRKYELAKQRRYLPPFPLSIEIEASYYCNLRCPFCPRVVNPGERGNGHMSQDLWRRVLNECETHQLPSILMDHEAESLMNPRFFDMVAEARDAGVFDIWLHTNANMLVPAKSVRLIDAGLTKINFSIDAHSKAAYDVLRVGGNFEKTIKNVRDFLRIKLEKGAFYLRTRVSFVEQRENLHEKKAFFDFWKKEPGINVISFQECIDFSPFEKPDEDWDLPESGLEQKYGADEPFHCSLPWEMPVIDVEGNVIPCGMPVREHTRDFILGNISHGSTIKSCWTGQKMNQLRELHMNGEWYKNPMCRVCVKTLRNSRKQLLQWREQVEHEAQLSVSQPQSAPAERLKER